MYKYKLCIINEEDEFLEALKNDNPKLRDQLCEKIKEIRENPFKSKFIVLHANEKNPLKKIYSDMPDSIKYRRARSGDYRIIYFVVKNRIFITRIGLRKTVYKRKYTA